MKLHHLILTAALFLTAGIASAAVVHENVYEEGQLVGETVSLDTAGMYIYHDNPGETPFIKLKDVSLTTNASSLYNFRLFSDGAGAHVYETWSQDLIANNTQDVYITQPTSHNKVLLQVLDKNNNVLMTSDIYYNSEVHNASIGHFQQEGNSILFNDGQGNTAKVTFGSPLPTPVITLLIALGFGAAFVMYRNRKQVKA